MTCIAARLRGRQVIFAGDRRVSWGEASADLPHPKIFRCAGEIWGIAGDLAAVQALAAAATEDAIADCVATLEGDWQVLHARPGSLVELGSDGTRWDWSRRGWAALGYVDMAVGALAFGAEPDQAVGLVAEHYPGAVGGRLDRLVL